MKDLVGNNPGANKNASIIDVIDKFGENNDIDTGSVPEVIWTEGGLFPFLTTAIDMDIVSGDIDDTSAGAGARTVFVEGYDQNDNCVSETPILNGTTRVELTNQYKIITRMQIETSGATQINEGRITIVDRATGLVIYQAVEIDEGQTLSAVQICPAGFRGVIRSHYATYSKIQAPLSAAQLRLRVLNVSNTIQTKYNITINSSHPEDEKAYLNGGIDIEAGEYVYWECIDVAANDTPVEAGFSMELYKI